MTPKWTSDEIEIAVAHYFDYRANIVVPNVSWGLGLSYEADVVVLRPSGFAVEVEIKVTASDIRADLRKRWDAHRSPLFRQLWFAVPAELQDCDAIRPEAGILAVSRTHSTPRPYAVTVVRPAEIRKDARKWSPKQRDKLLCLAAMRIFDLKLHRLRYWDHRSKP